MARRAPKFLSTMGPQEQLAFMRSVRPQPGARARLAAVPEWDGVMRFPSTGSEEPWTDWEIQASAWEALRYMATGRFGKTFPLAEDDPNDPPAVKQDILVHRFNPWK
jgi:hypothetical protein